MKMFTVGGCVRDEILGVASKDIDFSVVLEDSDLQVNAIISDDYDPFVIMVNELKDRGFRIFLETPEHLTVRAQFPDKYFTTPAPAGSSVPVLKMDKGLTADFVLARKEGGYSDGRRPDFVVPGTLDDDLARRDFTMNAIAKDENGVLIDPFNGQADIAARIVRAVGDPMERLTEDALRAVRAVRFALTKRFEIEPGLSEALEAPEVIDLIVNKISDERIDVELSKMFRFDTANAGHLLWGQYPVLTEALFAGSVSLDSTMKTKGRGK